MFTLSTDNTQSQITILNTEDRAVNFSVKVLPGVCRELHLSLTLPG